MMILQYRAIVVQKRRIGTGHNVKVVCRSRMFVVVYDGGY